MNKLRITTGGHNVRNEDILLVEEEMRKGFLSILSHLGTFFVIQGCEYVISGASITIDPGYVCIDGEIWFYPGETRSYNPAYFYYFKPNVTAANPRTYFDSSVNYTKEVRVVSVIEETLVNPSGYSVTENDRYEYLIQRYSYDMIGEILSGWTDSTVSPIGLYVGTAGTFTITFAKIQYKVIGKTIFISYDIEIVTTGGVGTSAQLAALEFSIPAPLQPLDVARKVAAAFWSDTAFGVSGAFAIASTPGIVRVRLQSPLTYSPGATINAAGQIILEMA